MVIIDELDLSVVCLDGYIYYEIVNGKKKGRKKKNKKKKKGRSMPFLVVQKY